MSKTETFGPPKQQSAPIKGVVATDVVPPPKPKVKAPKPSQAEVAQQKVIDVAIAKKQQELDATDAIFLKLAEVLKINDAVGDYQSQQRLAQGFHRIISTSEYQFLIDAKYTNAEIVTSILKAASRIRMKILAGSSSDLEKAKLDADQAEKHLAVESPKIQDEIAILQGKIEKLQSEVTPKVRLYKDMQQARRSLLLGAPDGVKRRHESAKREKLQPFANKIRVAKDEFLALENMLKIDDLQLRSLPEDHPVFEKIRNPSKPSLSLPTLSEYRLQNAPVLEELRQAVNVLVAERDAESDRIDSLFQDF